MNKKYFTIIILLIIMIPFFITCTSICHKQPDSEILKNPDQPVNLDNQNEILRKNRSSIVAEVLDIIELNEQRFYLHLKVINSNLISGFVNYAKENDELDTYPNYIRKEGQIDIDYSSVTNKHLQDARKLKNGDIINAIVYKTNNQKQIWSLVSWTK